MILGIVFAVISGLLWGLIFIGPLLIPEYPSILQASGRYIAFGLISLPLSWYDRARLRKLLLKDWLEAIKLVLTGHLVYYTCLTSAIQRIGVPISTAIIGTLPLMLTVTTHIISPNKQKLPNHTLLISLCLMGTGLLCVNISELRSEFFILNIWQYASGIILAIVSVLCWTWYALRNAHWLKTHPHNKPMTWANAQGMVTLPLSCLVYFFVCICCSDLIQDEFALPFGPRPIFFIFLMVLIGFCCSWLGTFFWNEASQRLPTTLIGPLIVVETVAGLIYSCIHQQLWPSPLILIGMFLLISGVTCIMQIRKNTH
ncbi:DMT family transporter [Blochmannia endosymbiont of Camponotus modoc]|uniref:DMT family transporter n=1 Tax=Blochmannia endosymbiont of Camponotus modoc TaxID=2945587 RepID=UPI002024AEF2|nr:DMT family transporter [Blochmannia endosymbiont of Camponotus modoc]URJ32053.1 DMT family transporter [Blochmannia endosymbiont of Camponotus modoc]